MAGTVVCCTVCLTSYVYALSAPLLSHCKLLHCTVPRVGRPGGWGGVQCASRQLRGETHEPPVCRPVCRPAMRAWRARRLYTVSSPVFYHTVVCMRPIRPKTTASTPQIEIFTRGQLLPCGSPLQLRTMAQEGEMLKFCSLEVRGTSCIGRIECGPVPMRALLCSPHPLLPALLNPPPPLPHHHLRAASTRRSGRSWLAGSSTSTSCRRQP
jgi:hypothetical protein